MWWRSIWLTPLFFVVSMVWAHEPPTDPQRLVTHDQSCEPYFTPQYLKLFQVLKDVPALRIYILEMAEDPNVGPYVKALLKRSLLDVDIEVVNLTSELREQYEVPDWWAAFAQQSKKPPTWNYPSAPTEAQALGLAKYRSARDFSVLLSDEKSYFALRTLIHELAHTRLQAFLLKNYDEICRRFPSTFAKYIDGRCALQAELVRFIHEKYAYETEWRVLGKIYPLYFKDQLPFTDTQLADLSPRYRAPEIGKWLITKATNYKFTTPQITILWDRPVSEVLLAGDRVQAIDDAVKLVVNDPGIESPQIDDFYTALSLMIFLRQARGFAKVKKTTVDAFAEYLEHLINQPNDGPKRAQRILAAAVLYADKYPECKSTLTTILSWRPVSQQLRRLHWRKVLGEYIDWNNLDKFRKRLKPAASPTDGEHNP